MIRFLDGPADGVELRLMRTPIMLRVVRSAGGTWDALDQPDDTPTRSTEAWRAWCESVRLSESEVLA